MQAKALFKGLNDEIRQIKVRNPRLKDDAAFVLWFLQAYLVDSEEVAKKALTGDTSDKNIDAVLIDDKSKQANIIQGKFRESENHAEKRNDVLGFADLSLLPWERKSELEAFYSKLDPLVADKVKELVQCVRSKKYELRLFYVTTGRCSDTIIREAKERVRNAEGPADIRIIPHRDLMVLFKNYLADVTPHIPPLTLRIISEGAILNEGVIRRFEPEKRIESWVFTMSGEDVGEMYNKVGKRLFARNIRGYLGDTDINNSMAQTIKKENNNFWYYNNGVTIVCDDAKREMEGGEDVLIVEGAQVINGQQTTITLSKGDSKGTHVLVKVIKIPRNVGEEEDFDRLVNSIVRATNWQNHIKPSDLVSNDSIQIFLEKELRKRGYQYIRKSMSKSEAKRFFGDQTFIQINKTEMAQAVAACLFDPYIVRKGKEGLFEDPHYKSIFGSRSVSFYLPKYWLMKEVAYAARGYPNRAYAKWLVLNFAWDLLGKHIDSKNSEKRFRYACEQEDDSVLAPLNKALIDISRAAMKFYKLNRGEGEEAKDISTFFQLTKLHDKFKAFWKSNKNNYKERVNKEIDRFVKHLNQIELEV